MALKGILVSVLSYYFVLYYLCANFNIVILVIFGKVYIFVQLFCTTCLYYIKAYLPHTKTSSSKGSLVQRFPLFNNAHPLCSLPSSMIGLVDVLFFLCVLSFLQFSLIVFVVTFVVLTLPSLGQY